MSTKEKRPRVGLTLPMIPSRDDGFAKEKERRKPDMGLQQQNHQHPHKRHHQHQQPPHHQGQHLLTPSPLSRPCPLPLPLPCPQATSPVKTSEMPGAAVAAVAGGFNPCGPTFAASRITHQQEHVAPEDTFKLKVLGHGSSGKVYKVQHKKTGKVYALKVIQEKHEFFIRKQILREMDILRRSSSPYIVSCYGAADRGGEISFVLEYMNGGSLADVLEARTRISEEYLSKVAKQVLQGLDYLHRNKIVHRDIKPSNLLLNHKQEVKIADFGVSTVLASTLAPCNSFVGTCAYMSPERFDPDSHGGIYSGYSADIWSLGLSLLECAMGHFPYLSPGQKADWPTLMVAICYGDPPQAPANASPEFKDFIMHCLWKDPDQRPRASALLSHPFLTKYEDKTCNIVDLLSSLRL